MVKNNILLGLLLFLILGCGKSNTGKTENPESGHPTREGP